MAERVWLLLHLKWECPEGETPASCSVHSSRTKALEYLYGIYGGEESARLQWVRRRDGFYEAYDPEEPGALWQLWDELPDGHQSDDWREFGFTGDLPDLDHAPAEWPDD